MKPSTPLRLPTVAPLNAPSYPATYQRTCPVCGERVIANMRAGQLMLDYHHDRRCGYVKWCSGSDMNLSDRAT